MQRGFANSYRKFIVPACETSSEREPIYEGVREFILLFSHPSYDTLVAVFLNYGSYYPTETRLDELIPSSERYKRIWFSAFTTNYSCNHIKTQKQVALKEESVHNFSIINLQKPMCFVSSINRTTREDHKWHHDIWRFFLHSLKILHRLFKEKHFLSLYKSSSVKFVKINTSR